MKKTAVIISLGLIAVLIVSISLALRVGSKEIEPSYPNSWNRISTGMSMREIDEIIGPPASDVRGLKTMDSWVIFEDGTKLVLNIVFERIDSGDFKATHMFRHKKRDDIIYEKERFPWN